MLKLIQKIPKRKYNSKFMYINETEGRDGMSGLHATIIGSSGAMGAEVVSKLGSIGTEMILPVRNNYMWTNRYLTLRCYGSLGTIYLHYDFNMNDPHMMKRLVKPSNLVINMAGPDFNLKTKKQFEEVNLHLPRRLAKVSKKMGVKKFIHISALGACPDSPSLDLQTKYAGEQAVLNEFPEAIVLRMGNLVSNESVMVRQFIDQQRLLQGFQPIFSDLQAKKQPIVGIDIQEVIMNAIKMNNANGKIYEIGGPHVYSVEQLLELKMNITRKPLKIFKLPEFITKKLDYLQIRHFYKEMVIQQQCDQYVTNDPQYGTIKDLMVDPVSIVPDMQEFLKQDVKTINPSQERNLYQFNFIMNFQDKQFGNFKNQFISKINLNFINEKKLKNVEVNRVTINMKNQIQEQNKNIL